MIGAGSRVRLPRRTFLRGAAVALGLPALEAMFNAHGDALAGGGEIPKRFGVWFWGNGAQSGAWVPSTTGPGWDATPLLSPLMPLAAEISVVSGHAVRAGSSTAHHVGKATALSGSYDSEAAGTNSGRATLPSCDQIAADFLQGDAPVRSLALGISEHGFQNTTAAHCHAWVDPASPIPAQHSPAALFDELVALGKPTQEEPIAPRWARKGVLDLVKEDADALRSKLSASDRQRLDSHLDGVRALEAKLDAPALSCTFPPRPGDIPYVADHELLAEKNAAMSELLRLALSCDATRVFNYTYTVAQADTVFWSEGLTEGMHTATHDSSMEELVREAIAFVMRNLAVTLQQLRDTEEGAGTLLDHCAIYCTSEVEDGRTHKVDDMPVLVAGRAGGSLVSGLHVRASGQPSISRIPFTLLRAVGADVASFGEGVDAATEEVAELLD